VGNAQLLDQDAIAGTELLGHIRENGDLVRVGRVGGEWP
jgi:hypothetical protein